MWNFGRPDIGIGHSEIFGLAARIAAKQMRVAEQAGRRMAPQLLDSFVVGIGSLAARVKAALLEKTFAASDRERNDDAVADLEVFDVGADLDHLAHGFMSENVAFFH